MSESYGPLVRLWGIHPSQLPSATATPAELTPFLASILHEALPFIDSVPPSQPTSGAPASSPWKPKGTKTYAHSAAPVHLYERTVPASSLRAVAQAHRSSIVHLAPAADSARPETWVLRRSTHEDAPKAGTAAWAEWTRCFKEDHAGAERAFTPTVARTAERRRWDCGGAAVELDGTTWEGWTLRLEESVHRLPGGLLRDRVFPVVQATAAARGRRDFLVVQVAARGDGPEEVQGEGGEKLVRGAYTSVERVRETGGGGSVEWTMGTASDAGGVLPAWMQRMAVPGQVAKDVDMFLGWIATQREKTKPDGEDEAGGEASNGAARGDEA